MISYITLTITTQFFKTGQESNVCKAADSLVPSAAPTNSQTRESPPKLVAQKLPGDWSRSCQAVSNSWLATGEPSSRQTVNYWPCDNNCCRMDMPRALIERTIIFCSLGVIVNKDNNHPYQAIVYLTWNFRRAFPPLVVSKNSTQHR